MLTVLNSLAPVFLVIALGWLLRRQGFLSSLALQDISRLTYWVGLPCLLFYKLAEVTPAFTEVGDLLLVTAGATAIGIGLSYLLARLLGVPWIATGTFVQAAFRGNLAFVGLPVVFYAFSGPGENAVMAEATALLIFGPIVVLYNIGAVLILLLSRERINPRALGKMSKELLANPLLLACLAGVLYSLLNWPLPTFLNRTFAAIGQMALPMALLCIGGSLVAVRFRGNFVWSATAASTKVVLMPLLGYGLARLLELSPHNTRIALILLACPTAAASYVLVRQIGGDETLASGAILFSTMLAALVLALILTIGR